MNRLGHIRLLAGLGFVLVSAAVLATRAVWSQGEPPEWVGSGEWGRQGQYGRLYDPETVTSLAGENVDVQPFQPRQGRGRGIHLTLRVAEGRTLEVHLGPLWFIERQDARLTPGDRITVTGSRIQREREVIMVAAEIRRKGDATMQLRSPDGFPRWVAWRRRRAP